MVGVAWYFEPEGITAGATEGITAGATEGTTAGATEGITAGATGADITAGAAAAAARSEFPERDCAGMAGGAGRPPRNVNMSFVDMGAARTLFIT